MSDALPRLYTANASGQILDCGSRGRSLAVYPAVDVGNVTSIPGSYPVTVRFRGGGKRGELLVIDGRFHAFGPDDVFEGFDIVGCDAGDTWAVVVAADAQAGFFPASQRSAVPVALQNTAVAVPTSNPASATDGWPLRPGMTKFTLFFSGTARTNRLWIRQLNGTWFDTGQDYAGADLMVGLQVDVPGNRFALVASGASQNVRIEARYEVG